VSLANRMAIASSSVRALTVEANEFPRLAREFQVSGVPRTVVNRGGAFVGAMPEEQFVTSALKLAGVAVDEEPPDSGKPPEVEPV
jgi:predicted DsbA family dithiol-disulfide isomerase